MSNIVQQTTQIYGRSGIITSAGTLLAENQYRVGLIIQNLGVNPLFVKFGSGASTSDFDVVLKGGSGSDDGLGGTFSPDVLCFTSIITVAGTNPRCTATEW